MEEQKKTIFYTDVHGGGLRVFSPLRAILVAQRCTRTCTFARLVCVDVRTNVPRMNTNDTYTYTIH